MEDHFKGSKIRDIILGTQDGLVNVLGLVLGVASATNSTLIVIVAGLAATFAETISMAAVAYTATKAERDYYQSEYNREKREVEEIPDEERREIRDIYYKKGFRGKILDDIVKKITSNKKVWIDTMMREELMLPSLSKTKPLNSFAVVFIATLIGSVIPLAPFLLLAIGNAMLYTLVVSIAALFLLGIVKARMTTGGWLRSGFESAIIGMTAAVVSYGIGYVIGQVTGISAIGI